MNEETERNVFQQMDTLWIQLAGQQPPHEETVSPLLMKISMSEKQFTYMTLAPFNLSRLQK